MLPRDPLCFNIKFGGPWSILSTGEVCALARRVFVFWLLCFLIYNAAVTLFRMIGALGRNLVVANALGSLVLLVLVMLGGFSLSKHYIHPWWIWACEWHPSRYLCTL